MVSTILVGVVAAVVSVGAHQADTAFVYEQQHPTGLEPAQLQSILANTRDPLPVGAGTQATSVRCSPGRSGPKLNPWICQIRYRSGHTIRYRIVVQPSGRFHGSDRTGTREVSGCCVRGTASPRA
jgi:hypothetical protein